MVPWRLAGDDLAPHPAGLHHAPAGRFQGGIDEFGAGFGLIHAGVSGNGRGSRAGAALVGSPGEPFVSDKPLDVIPCGYQMAGMTRPMDGQTSRPAPRALTDGLDASTRDLTAGRVGDADAAQREARRMLEAFEKARAGAKDRTRAKPE
jgi:hypothetical protein